MAAFVEAHQVYADYLDSLLNVSLNIDPSVTVVVEGTTIRFENVEKMAEWLAEKM